MAITAREIEAFLNGEIVSEEVIAQIEIELQDPTSIASVIGRRISNSVKLFASSQGPLPAIDAPPVTEPFENLRSLNQQFTEAFQQKRWAEALELRLITCRLALRYLGPENRDTCTYINSVGRILLEQREFDRAARVFQSAIEMRSKALGDRHSDTGISWTGLGRALEGVGDYQESRECHRLALGISEETLGPNHPDTGVALSELGLISLTLEDFATARECFQRALDIAREIEGEGAPIFAGALIHMGCVEEATGDHGAAEGHFRHAYAVMLESRGPHHEDVAWALNHLGGVLLGAKQYIDALREFQSAEEILDQLGDESFLRMSVQSNLSIALSMTKQVEAAVQTGREASRLCRSLFGKDHATTQTMARNLYLLEGNLMPEIEFTLKPNYRAEFGKSLPVFELLAA